MVDASEEAEKVLRHQKRAEQTSGEIRRARRATPRSFRLATSLPGRWEDLPIPRIAPQRVVGFWGVSREYLARALFWLRVAPGAGPKVAKLQAQSLPSDSK